jgi:hypothetical protein
MIPEICRLQRYEKSSAEASDSLIMPRRSIFDGVKDTNKRGQKQACLQFAEREYLGRSQRYEKSGAEANFRPASAEREYLRFCQR